MGTSGGRSGENAPSGGEWTGLKARVTRITHDGNGDLRGVLSDLVSAWRGGSGGTSSIGGGGGAKRAAVGVGQRLGGFLSDVSRVGLDEALRNRGLGAAVGQTVLVVISQIVDYVAGDATVLDEVVVRAAVVEVWSELLGGEDEDYAEMREDLERQVDGAGVSSLMGLFIAEVIFQRFLVDLAERIEANAITAAQAELLEDRVLNLIRGMVRFQLRDVDVLHFDWTGEAAAALLAENLELALSALEE